MNPFTFETAPRIVCAQGCADTLAEYVKSLGGHRVLVVTDPGLVSAGVITPALRSLEGAGIGVEVFSDVRADPPESVVAGAVQAATACAAEVIVGLGGGSSMDTAKLAALLARTPQPLDDVYGIDRARGPRLPLIQVPTTAGTGSEVTPIAIVTTASNEKKGVVSSVLYPDAALLDSTLTLGLPSAPTAMTGVDAIVHAIEAYTNRHRKNPVSDTFALQALKLLYPTLPQVIADGRDRDARERMLLGSLMAGMAFANSPCAAVHALAYPLGGHYHLPHGLTNSLMLVPVLNFNLPAATREYAQLGRAILGDSGSMPDHAVAERFVEALGALVSSMPYAQNLRSAGVERDFLPALADDAMNVQRLLVNNPREVTRSDALRLYEAAF